MKVAYSPSVVARTMLVLIRVGDPYCNLEIPWCRKSFTELCLKKCRDHRAGEMLAQLYPFAERLEKAEGKAWTADGPKSRYKFIDEGDPRFERVFKTHPAGRDFSKVLGRLDEKTAKVLMREVARLARYCLARQLRWRHMDLRASIYWEACLDYYHEKRTQAERRKKALELKGRLAKRRKLLTVLAAYQAVYISLQRI
jgi:hypothetical protein